MKKLMTVAMVALFVAGSTSFACSGCGCSAEKKEAKKECSKEACKDKKSCSDKKACSDKKTCSTNKTECAKSE